MFFALEKKNYINKNMKTIITDCGKHIIEQKGILEEQTKFFKSLYQKDKNICFKYTRGPDEPYLDLAEQHYCDQELTIDELFDATAMLKSGKCPGGDGLPNEFYFKFFKQLGPHLLSMANHTYVEGILPQSTRRGVISLSPTITLVASTQYQS